MQQEEHAGPTTLSLTQRLRLPVTGGPTFLLSFPSWQAGAGLVVAYEEAPHRRRVEGKLLFRLCLEL